MVEQKVKILRDPEIRLDRQLALAFESRAMPSLKTPKSFKTDLISATSDLMSEIARSVRSMKYLRRGDSDIGVLGKPELAPELSEFSFFACVIKTEGC